MNLKEAKIGLINATLLTFVLWSALILIGIGLTVVGVSSEKFNVTTMSAIDFAVSSFSKLPSPFQTMGLFAFFIGLFSAMVSTADSLLMAATHTFLNKSISSSDPHNNITIKQAQLSMLALSITSFLIFIIFYVVGFNVVQLVFAIYGAQLALFPATYLAVQSNKYSLKAGGLIAGLSIFLGFTAAWAFAIVGQISGNWELQFYAPVAALVVSVLVLGVPFLFRMLLRKPS